MEFEKRKAATLASMNSPEPDKSPKGNIDAPILPLLAAINSHPSYFTTSSCSGRISIFAHPTAPSNNPKKAKGGTWVFISHDPVDPDSVSPLLFGTTELTQSPGSHSLVFRFEPLIIAIECRDVEAAQLLVSLAISCGFRESGITSATNKRVIIAVRCSIRLEVPLGYSDRIMVSPEYLKFLVELANEKMGANRKRTDGFLDALLKNGFLEPQISNGKVLGNNEVDSDECSGFLDGPESEFLGNSSRDGMTSHKNDENTCGSPAVSGINPAEMPIAGESIERLFLWGHSASAMDGAFDKKVLVFGGFGGPGRHTRRNDLLLLDLPIGKLEVVDVQETPSSRLGHTSSIVEKCMYVIGGRADPSNILNDVWAFSIANKEWRLLQCSGSLFPPRHRHAAAVVGSKIYIFGGIHNDVILSSLHVLDTQAMTWNELEVKGELPCPRHSHSMVAYGTQLYIFGGNDGERPLGDLYSFDTKTLLWKKENMSGRPPSARFSHSMFVYKNFLGIIGGCPVSQSYHQLSLIDLHLRQWKHVVVSFLGKGLLVRSTANIVGDDLIMIGGGAACYAFGTRFSEPMKINLLTLISEVDNSINSDHMNRPVDYQQGEGIETKKTNSSVFSQKGVEMCRDGGMDKSADPRESDENDGKHIVASCWVVRLERKYAKLVKDILKKFGWLDLGRKVYSQDDGVHICFPVTEKFCSIFPDIEESDDFDSSKPFLEREHLLKDISSSTALKVLMECHATKIKDEVLKVKKATHTPLEVMKEAVASLISQRGLPPQLLEQLPSRWERLGDIVVLPMTCFKDPEWDSIGEELWCAVAKSLGARRLARQGRVAPTGTRDSTLEILVGDNGWVDHRENGILYSFDTTKCMFSWGNLSEKLRMARLDCTNEVIVDLFAGIGYFVLPFLVRANAKLVYACEWNPLAIEALRHNLHANLVADRCVVLEGDNRITAPKGIAHRVCLGLLPTSEGSWVTAVRALREEGGIMHIHENVKDSEEASWTQYVSQSIQDIAQSEGRAWEVSVEHMERVKWYAPHIRHLVVDLRSRSNDETRQVT
nr:tRNA wybutosine-synthesizing protein 2/3/4 [Ipomoea batatas]